MYYKKEINCNFCNHNFETTKIITRKAKFTHMDNDFCRHYEEDNPTFYDALVCPNCGFAFTAAFRKLTPTRRKVVEDNYINKVQVIDYTGARTVQEALNAFKLSLLVAEIAQERNIVIADICLKTAWIYRIIGNKEQEERFLTNALESFENALSRDDLSKEDIEEDRLIYLMAEINVRLDNYITARKWFSYLITNKSVSKQYRNLAVSSWQDYKDSSKNKHQG